MNKIYILLGSNMGDRSQQLALAKKQLTKTLGTVKRESKIYQTAAWGKRNQPDFLNQVLILETKKDAASCMALILEIEHIMGRTRTVKNAARTIDIDILYFNRAVLNTPDLIVPHPAIQDRRFVLIPLNELSPGFKHPVLGKTNHQLLLECADPLDVKKI
jgi:2-amino-4-hydroxy-6-hydroxymethyldihydropteridine diphosphokinase